MDGPYLLWMCFFYVVTIAIETPILMAGLSRRHPMMNRVFAGVWLSACTYPFVWIVFPLLIDTQNQKALYLAVAETFAPVAECLLFWVAFGNAQPRTRANFRRDMAVIILANLASFGVGLVITRFFFSEQEGLFEVVRQMLAVEIRP
jgi:hypothetical protein